MGGSGALVPSRWTRPLQLVTAWCSLVFAIGTAVQTFVVIDLPMLELAQRLAGASRPEAAQAAPGLRDTLRAVGIVYLAGNAVGVLAVRGYAWVYWVALVVNLTQATGVVLVPTEVLRASAAELGVAGVLPTLVTDGGAVLLGLALLGFLLRFRTPWARRRAAAPA
ncbi:hypothetical protein SAMN05421810_109133 [Amycolatopsis arida]|uniref:DUF2127 domain-containing protein n=1 Tax=Amycolatopsis arida TaxID=587909 RepID=A0A1I5ZEY4_9PSEU|nr:hypothetical protein [Amycolatopsis arida]TDX89611.1 hypothetical protein CLV69_109132 [Amycolatopsis arida]SFQ55059.1 hypothetical protein SAMN05421810_109133 [Amycolatopsis arida]